MARRILVDAIRRKMADFDYRVSSIAPELFQNADDAVAELLEMQSSLGAQERQFYVSFNRADRILDFVHWGRPINRHECPGFRRGAALGYDQDIQKMLTLNFSDKGVETGGHAPSVTGRFGLGFKSVFFVADQPEVISGRLAFQIRGGFYPVALSPVAAEDLRGTACRLGVVGSVPTAIRLALADEITVEKVVTAIQGFKGIAALLTVFSRQIRTLTITQDSEGRQLTMWKRHLPHTAGWYTPRSAAKSLSVFDARFGRISIPRRSSSNWVQVVLHSPRKSCPAWWITTPTGERSDLRWVLNAPFKPDAGRQRLALNSQENSQIADEIAVAFGQGAG